MFGEGLETHAVQMAGWWPISKLQNLEAEGPQRRGIWPGVTSTMGRVQSAPGSGPGAPKQERFQSLTRAGMNASSLTNAHVDGGFE